MIMGESKVVDDDVRGSRRSEDISLRVSSIELTYVENIYGLYQLALVRVLCTQCY